MARTFAIDAVRDFRPAGTAGLPTAGATVTPWSSAAKKSICFLSGWIRCFRGGWPLVRRENRVRLEGGRYGRKPTHLRRHRPPKAFTPAWECVSRKLDTLTTNLVVADVTRSEKTICLAVSPSLKACGIPGRPRLFEVVQKVREVNRQRLADAVRAHKAVRRGGRKMVVCLLQL